MIAWDGGPTGNGVNWHDAANWIGDVLPGADDDVIINVAANPTIIFNATTGSQSIRSFTCAENLTMSGGTLTIAEASSTSGTLTLSTGTITGAGDLVVTGALTWNSGAMSGTGVTRIQPGATVSLASATKTLSRTLEVLGTGTWSAGTIAATNGGVLIIGSGATLNATGTVSLTGTGVGNQFQIVGSLARPSGAGVATIGGGAGELVVSVDPAATISVSTGTLTFAAPVPYQSITVNGTSTVSFSASQSHSSGSSITGTGNVSFAAGTHVYEGTLGNTGTLTIAGTLDLPTARTLGQSTTLTGTLTGAGDAVFTNSLAWNGGTMSGSGRTTIGAAATLAMGSLAKTLSRDFTLLGTGTWSAGNVSASNATFTIGSGGTLNLTGTTSYTATAGASVFTINGTLARPSGTGTATIGGGAGNLMVAADPAAMIAVSAGTVSFASAIDYTAIQVTSPGTVQFAASQSHAPGATISGTGNVLFSGGTHVFGGTFSHTGTITINGATAVLDFPADRTISQNLTLTSGTLTGNGVVEVTGLLTWNGGTMAGAGLTQIAATGTLALGSSTRALQRNLESFGATTWSGATINATNATFTNRAGATITSTTSGQWNGTAGVNAFINEGTFTVTLNANSSLLVGGGTAGVSFMNASTGVVNISGLNNSSLEIRRGGANAGTINVTGPSRLQFNGAGNFDGLAGSTLSGDGGLSVLVGTVDFASGTLGLTGAYSFSGGSTTIRSGTLPSSVAISGSSTLNLEADQSWSTITLTGGTLAGSAMLTVTGTATWSAGAMAGTGVTRIAPGATMTMATFSLKTLGRVVENFGTTAWTQGNVSSFDGTFINQPGGTFNVDPFGWNAQGGTSIVRNLGTMNVAFSAATNGSFADNAFTLIFDNGDAANPGAVINITSLSGTRTLTLDAIGTNFGQIHVGAGVTLVLVSDRTYAPGSVIDGDGAVRFTAGTHTFDGSLATTGGFTMQSFGNPPTTVNFNASVTIPGVASIAGVMGGSGLVTFTGSVEFPGATLSGSGTTRIAPGATATLTSGGLTLSRTFENLGTTTHVAGLVFLRGGTFTNAVGGVYNATASINWQGQTGVNAFNNAGTLNSSAIFGFIDFPALLPFNNLAGGVVNVNAFTFDLDSGGSNAGVINVAAGATLELDGTTTHAPGSLITGAGSVTVSGGTHDLSAGMFTPTGAVSFTGGTTTIANAFSPTGAVTINGTGAAAVINAEQTWTAITLSAGTLGGSGIITLTGASTWNGGAMTGSGTTRIAPGGTLTIDSSNLKTLARTLENQGTTDWAAGNVESSGGTLRNAVGGIFNAQAVATWTAVGGANLIDNQGFFEILAPGIVTFTRGSSNLSFFNGGPELDAAFFGGGPVGVAMEVDELRNRAQMDLALGFAAFLRVAHMDHSGTVTGEGSVTIEPVVPGGACTVDVLDGTFDHTGNLTFGVGCRANFETDVSTAATTTIRGEITGPGNVEFAGSVIVTGSASFTGAGGTRFSGATVALQPEGTDREVTVDRGVEFAGTSVSTPTGAYTWRVRSLPVAGREMVWDDVALTVPSGATFRVQGAAGAADGYVWRVRGFNTKLGAGAVEFLPGPVDDAFAVDLGATFDVAAGTANLLAGGSSSGTFSGAVGSTLRLGGDWVLDTDSAIAGGVQVFYEDGTTEILGGHTTTGTVTVQPGAIADYRPASPVTILTLNLRGEVTGSSDLAVRTLNWHGGGIASGTGALAGSGEPTSSFNYVSNGVAPLGLRRRLELTFAALNPNGLPDDLVFDMNGGSALIPLNQLIQLDVGLPRQTVFRGVGGDNAVIVEGTLNKIGSGAVRFVDGGAPVRLNIAPTGRVNVQAGSLDALAGGESSGIVDIATGTNVRNAGLWRYLPGSTVQGNGGLTISGGVTTSDVSLAAITGSIGVDTGATLTANANTDLSAPTTIKGFLDGAARLRLLNSLTAQGGSRLANTGGIDVSPTGSLVLSNSLTSGPVTLATDVDNSGNTDIFVAVLDQEDSQFRNNPGGNVRVFVTSNGGLTWTRVGTSSITNAAGATLTAESDATIFVAVANQGTIIASGTSTPGTSANLAIPNLSNIAGTTLGGGRYEVRGLLNPASISFGRLVTDTTSDIALIGNGASMPDLNTLTRISGDGSLQLSGGRDLTLETLAFGERARLVLDPGSDVSTTTFDMGPETILTVRVLRQGAVVTSGRLIVGNTANLAGTLNVQGLSGYVPMSGDQVSIVSAGTRVGQFATTNLPSTPTGLTGSVAYSPTGVTYRVDPTTGQILWTGGAGDGLWRTASNWDLLRVPQLGDDVVIAADPTISAIVFDTTAAINSLTSEEPLRLVSGQLNLARQSSTFDVTIEGTVLINQEGLLVLQTLDLRGGAIIGPGGVTIPGIMVIRNGTTTFDSTFFTVSRIDWEGGNVDSRNASVTFTSPSDFNVTTTGTSTWRAIQGSTSISGDFDYLQTGGGTVNFVQDPGASMGIGLGSGGSWTIDVGRTNYAVSATWAGPLSIGSQGTLALAGLGSRFLGGSGTPHQIDGNLLVESGAVNLARGIAGAGNLNVATGALASISGASTWAGSVLVNTGATLQTAANVALTGAASQIDGTLAVQSGTLTVDRPISGSGQATVAPFSGLSITGTAGTYTLQFDVQPNAFLRTAADVTLGGTGAPNQIDGALEVQSGTLTLTRSISGAGQATVAPFSGLSITGTAGTYTLRFDVQPNAFLRTAADVTLGGTGAPNQIDGALEVQSGVLILNRALAGNGALTVASGALASLDADSTWSGSILLGAGASLRTRADVTVGTLDSLGTVAVERGTLTAGNVAQLVGSGLVGGTWNVGDGSNQPATLNMPGAITSNMANVSLTGLGTAFPALVSNLLFNGGFLGVNAPVIFPNSIDNSSIFSVPGPGNVRVMGNLVNRPGAQTVVSAGGMLTVDGNVDSAGTFGGVNGTTSVGGTFTNTGAHTVANGSTVTTAGAYLVSGDNAVTTVEQGGALNATGSAGLAVNDLGTLNVSGGSVSANGTSLDAGQINAADAQALQLGNVNLDRASAIDLTGTTQLQAGTIDLLAGSRVSLAPGSALDATGSVRIGVGSLFDIDAGAFSASSLEIDGEVRLTGDPLPGIASIAGDVRNRGTLRLIGRGDFTSTGSYFGETPSILSIGTFDTVTVHFDGNVETGVGSQLTLGSGSSLDAGASLLLGLGSTTTFILNAGEEAPRLSAAGFLLLNGQLVVNINGTPMVGESFELVAGDIAGSFTGFMPITFPGGVRAELVQTPTQVRIDVVGPAVGTWIGPAGGDWNDPANWAQNILPGPNNDVIINIPGGTFTITHSGGTSSVRSITSQENITLSGGSLSVAQPSTIDGHFTLNGGNLVRDDIFNFNGGFSHISGTIGGDGDAIFGAGTTYTIDSGASPIGLGGSFTVLGTANWFSGDVLMNNAVFTIALSGVLNAAAAGFSWAAASGVNSVLIAGLLLKSSLGASTISAPVSNTGTVRVNVGSLAISNLVQLSGTILAAGNYQLNGGALLLPGQQVTTVGADAVVEIRGSAAFDAVTLVTDVDGTLRILDGADFNTAAGLNVRGSVEVLNGAAALTVNGNLFVDSTGLFRANAAVVDVFGNILLSGHGDLGPGLYHATGSFFVEPGGSASLGQDALLTIDGSGRNQGTLSINRGVLDLGTTFTNEIGASVMFSGGGGLLFGGSAINRGTITGDAAFSLQGGGNFQQNGSLTLPGGSDFDITGTFTDQAGVTTSVGTGSTFGARGGAAISGTFSADGSDVNFGPDVPPPGSAGLTIADTGNVLLTGVGNTLLVGGAIDNSGGLNAADTGVLAGSTGYTGRAGSTFVLNGATNAEFNDSFSLLDGASLAIGGSSRLDVGGTIDLSGGATLNVSIDSATSSVAIFAGDVNLDGTLNVTFGPGYTMTRGDNFQFITGNVAGNFDAITLPAASGFVKPIVLRDNTLVRIFITSIVDFNNDGEVNPDDLSDFITTFFLFPFTLDPLADFNEDGDVNPDDLSDFITLFFMLP